MGDNITPPLKVITDTIRFNTHVYSLVIAYVNDVRLPESRKPCLPIEGRKSTSVRPLQAQNTSKK